MVELLCCDNFESRKFGVMFMSNNIFDLSDQKGDLVGHLS